MPQEVVSLLKAPCVNSDNDEHGDWQDSDEGEEDDKKEFLRKCEDELDVIASDEKFFVTNK